MVPSDIAWKAAHLVCAHGRAITFRSICAETSCMHTRQQCVHELDIFARFSIIYVPLQHIYVPFLSLLMQEFWSVERFIERILNGWRQQVTSIMKQNYFINASIVVDINALWYIFNIKRIKSNLSCSIINFSSLSRIKSLKDTKLGKKFCIFELEILIWRDEHRERERKRGEREVVQRWRKMHMHRSKNGKRVFSKWRYTASVCRTFFHFVCKLAVNKRGQFFFSPFAGDDEGT